MKQSEDKKSLSEKNPVADFIFFFGTCYAPAVNLGLLGGKLVVAGIKYIYIKSAMYPLTSVIIFIIPIKLRNCN